MQLAAFENTRYIRNPYRSLENSYEKLPNKSVLELSQNPLKRPKSTAFRNISLSSVKNTRHRSKRSDDFHQIPAFINDFLFEQEVKKITKPRKQLWTPTDKPLPKPKIHKKPKKLIQEKLEPKKEIHKYFRPVDLRFSSRSKMTLFSPLLDRKINSKNKRNLLVEHRNKREKARIQAINRSKSSEKYFSNLNL